jgi:hypothetical protein
MRFWRVLVPILAVAAAIPAAFGEEANPPGVLRGGLVPSDDAAPILPDSSASGDATPSAVDLSADDDALAGRAPRENLPMAPGIDDEAATGSVRRPPEDDPFAALGIRAGGFIFFPSVEVSSGYSTNASGVAGGAGSGFWTVTPELQMKSDWARHEATLTMRGSYEGFTDGETQGQPAASIEATGRADLPDDWTADFSAGYNYSLQSISDPNFPAGVDEAPGVHDLITTAALNGHLGRMDFTLAGTAERTIYENGMAGNVVVDQSDRINNRYVTRLRVGYQLTPAITPFVEGEFAWRVFDRPIDDYGIARSSISRAIRTGIAYDGGPILKGELAVGARREVFDDPGLATLRALTVDGSLTWAPTKLTTVTVAASTGFNPADDPLSSGSIVYDTSVELAYAWRRNVTVKLTGAYKNEAFQGLDLQNQTYNVGIGWIWKLNRTLQLTAGYVHQWLESSDPAVNYHSDAVRIGLRVQR